MSREPAPGDKQGGQERNTTEGNGDGKGGLKAVHVSDNDSRELLRCKFFPKLRGARCNHSRTINSGGGRRQLDEHLVDKGSLGGRNGEGTPNCLEDCKFSLAFWPSSVNFFTTREERYSQ